MTTTDNTNSSPADELRRAASLMRERAEKATPGPWESLDGGDRLIAWKPSPDGQFDDDFDYVVDDPISNAANAEHIASWHPAVALAVANWLDDTAELQSIADLNRDDAPAVEHALAIARAYLGTTHVEAVSR